MSVQDRYSKIIESLVNGEGDKASDLLHEAFVDKAREIWSGLVEQDEIVEDDISEEEEIEESYFDEDVDSFEEEIEAEEEYAMEDEEDSEAEFELASDDEMDMDAEGDMEMEPESEAGIEDAMLSVEDALADLKAEFAQLMGDDMGDEEEAGLSDELPADDFASDIEPEEEFEEQYAFEADESEELEEAADLTKIGKDGMHPSEMPAGDDGKASPVASKNDMGGKVVPTGAKSSEGSKKGLSDVTAKDMGVTHPGDGASLKPETRGHGAEKRGMKQ
jgi:hypothetical protein|tara:strand:- start:5470 stop:6297 length:828 start_codon:yes stop_codon:yes gene_type:complete